MMKCSIVASYASFNCAPAATFCEQIAIKRNLLSSNTFPKNNMLNRLRDGRTLTATMKNSDDEKRKKLGGTTSTRNLFALTEVFGKISSVFNPNDDNDENAGSKVQNEIVQKTSLMTSEEIEQISIKIRQEYEAIFWAVSAFFISVFAEYSSPHTNLRTFLCSD